MDRRCAGCRAVMASDNEATMCSPCERAYNQAVSALATWLQRFFGKKSEVSAVLFADRVISLLSCGGRDGEAIRRRVLNIPTGR